MANLSIFEKLFDKVDIVTGNYIVNTATDIIAFITPIFNNLLIIYFALWGIAHLRGTIQEPLKDGLGRILRITFIIALALNVGMYCGIIADFLVGFPDQITSVATGAAPASALLDDLVNKGLSLGKTAWDHASIIDSPGMFFVSLIIWISTIIAVAYAGFLILFAKLAMVVLLALGPIFIILLLFQATQKFFEMWLAQIVNFGIIIILSISLIDLAFFIYQAHLTAVFNSTVAAGTTIGIEDTVAITITAVISFLIMRQVPTIAMALGGGIALATQGAISALLHRMPMTSWMMAARPSNIERTALGLRRDAQLAKGVMSTPGQAASNLYRRRFNTNSISRK